jgi:hypothetical protein
MRDALQVAPSDPWFRMRSPERAIRRAHRQLRSADRPHSTVGAIAHGWGFTHLGRFATAKHRSKPRALHSERTTRKGVYQRHAPADRDNLRRARIISQITRIDRRSEQPHQRTA